ncbi:MAG TPA: hypothetical protein VF251_01715 [Pyrinomonadaceae bacterium]
MNAIQQSINPKVSPLCTLMALALVVALGCFAQAGAQWTTPDASQNINNTNTGNVGIGTTTPGSLLEVKKSQNAGTTLVVDNPFTTAANSAYSGFLLKQGGVNRLLVSSVNDNHGSITPGTAQFWNFANGPTVFANNNAETMRLTAVGNLGIGTNSPGERLVTFGNMLVGNITSHTQLYSGYDAQSNMIMEVGYGTATANITPLASLVLSKNLTSTNQGLGVISFANSNIANGNEKRLATISVFTDGALNSGALVFGTTSAGTVNERMRFTSTGRVGIGTASPSTIFEVQGASQWIAKFKKTDNTNGGIIIDSNPGFNPNLALSVNGTFKWYVLSNASVSDSFQLYESTGSFSRFTLTQAGSLGLGTTSPSFKLDVQGGSVNATDGLCIAGTCKSSWTQVATQWANGTGNINYTGGSVGIGISSPLYSLDVNGGTNGFRAKAASISSSDTIATFENSAAIKMIVRANGNVGIGTTAPATPLDVAGDINASGTITGGNIKAKYQDVAEWVESSQDLPAGTVVILDPTKSNQVIASTAAYDSRVAGVISQQPGIELGEQGEGRVLVATTGRVRVKVDATNGPIQIGDLLVTSDKTGFAMKSITIDVGGARIHRPGTLIGKALEPLAQGTGEILVLLSLQ